MKVKRKVEEGEDRGVKTEKIVPAKSKFFTIWTFIEKVC